MNRKRFLNFIGTGLILGCGCLSKELAGYIDPGTGSYILQLAIAFLFGLALSFKVFRRKVVAFFKKIFSRKKANGTDVS